MLIMHDMHCHALAVRSPEWRKKNLLSCSSGTHRSCFVLRSHVPCIIQSFTSLMFLIHRLLFRLLTQTFTVILNDPAVFNLTPSNYPASSGVKMWFQDFFFLSLCSCSAGTASILYIKPVNSSRWKQTVCMCGKSCKKDVCGSRLSC